MPKTVEKQGFSPCFIFHKPVNDNDLKNSWESCFIPGNKKFT